VPKVSVNPSLKIDFIGAYVFFWTLTPVRILPICRPIRDGSMVRVRVFSISLVVLICCLNYLVLNYSAAGVSVVLMEYLSNIMELHQILFMVSDPKVGWKILGSTN